jgi:phage terminase small subunit
MIQRGRRSIFQVTSIGAPSPSYYNRPTIAREPPPSPDHLSPAMQAWWGEITKAFVLQPHQLRTLQAGAEAWDRCQQAREALEQHGLSYTDGNGVVRARPEVAVERDSRAAFMRAVRALGLGKIEPP